MSQSNGTPKTLDEVILLYVPHATTDEVREVVYAGVKDFLAQRFGAEILIADALGYETHAVALKKLFDNIVKR